MGLSVCALSRVYSKAFSSVCHLQCVYFSVACNNFFKEFIVSAISANSKRQKTISHTAGQGGADLRAQHALFSTLPADISPPVLARLAEVRKMALARRRLQGRPSSFDVLWNGWPRIAVALVVAALALLASRQELL
jgi:hypothetical protein